MSAPAARPREFAFGPDDHRAVAALAYAEAGIVLSPAKSQLVYGRLAPRVRARGLTTVADYLRLIETDAAERARTIDALTTNHTSFFREAHHFEDFVGRVWPPLARRLEHGGRVRLWSAACSSGEEPYTWMLALLGKDRRAGEALLRRDFRMLATDLSSSVLATAREGRYSADTLRTVPAGPRATWVTDDQSGGTVDPAVRAAIAFRPLNLLEDWPIRGQFDAICCRNVMIYFDEPTKARLQSRLADRLVEGGTLYIGHSERLVGEVADRLEFIGRTAFRKVKA